jgi:uncharacterized MAPEG superfamily protein
MPSAIDYMNAYKGLGNPDAIVPILALLIGSIPPYAISHLLSTFQDKSSLSAGSATMDNVVTTLQAMSLPAVLFLSEFVFGVLARSKSAKAGFSPAAVQAAGVQHFELIETNRIHQNHIESAFIYIPAIIAAAAAGVNSNTLVATTITWVLCRVIYRLGYRQHSNPLWRLVGTFSSLEQSLICLGLFANATFGSK